MKKNIQILLKLNSHHSQYSFFLRFSFHDLILQDYSVSFHTSIQPQKGLPRVNGYPLMTTKGIVEYLLFIHTVTVLFTTNFLLYILYACMLYIYSFGAGFGEDIPTAKEMAAREALKKIFGTEESMAPINFKMEGIPKSDSSERYQIAAN